MFSIVAAIFALAAGIFVLALFIGIVALPFVWSWMTIRDWINKRRSRREILLGMKRVI
jgi:hypothetical protein